MIRTQLINRYNVYKNGKQLIGGYVFYYGSNGVS